MTALHIVFGKNQVKHVSKKNFGPWSVLPGMRFARSQALRSEERIHRANLWGGGCCDGARVTQSCHSVMWSRMVARRTREGHLPFLSCR